MPVPYFVTYKGRARHHAALVERYRRKHVPILRTWPCIRGVSLHAPSQWRDSQSGVPADVAFVAQTKFDDIDAVQLALASETRLQARYDLVKFPPIEVPMIRQANGGYSNA